MTEDSRTISRLRRMIHKVLIVAIALTAMQVLPIQAQESRTIKVGCIDIEDFLVVDQDGNVSGYASEYLEKISKHTGWTYEYVNGSWAECLSWLKEGKIDLLMPAEYSEERAKDYLFSQDYCCMDYAALIGRKNNDKIYYEDFENFDGMTVGIIEGNYLNDVFDQYAAKHDFAVNKKSYANSESLEAALEEGEGDAIINGNMNYYDTQKLLAKIDYMPAYFITSVNQPDLMEELDRAQYLIHLENPYYAAQLHEKYYGEIERQAVGFTREEAEYIENADEVKVLCKADNYPLSWKDKETGEMKGIYPDFIKLLEKKSGMRFKISGYGPQRSAFQLLEAGKADVLLDAVSASSLKNKGRLALSDSFYDMPYVVLAYKGADNLQGKHLKAALPMQEENTEAWIEKEYPDWDVKFYDSWEGCVKALKKGQVDIVPVNTAAWQTLYVFRDETELMNITTSSFQVPLCVAMSEENPEPLISVMNKLILKLDSEEVSECILENTLRGAQKVTFKELVRQYPVQMIVIGIFIAVLVVLFIGLAYIYRLKARQNRALEEKNAQLEEAHRLEKELTHKMEIDKLTGLFDKITAENSCRKYLVEGGTGVLLIFDIDNFKKVNDCCGHSKGDDILRNVGKILRLFCRSDDIAGRVGGDEFLVFLKEMKDRETVRQRLEVLKGQIRELGKSREVDISCSIGVAFAPEDGGDFDSLFNSADQAMYKAKGQGKDCYKFY